MEISKEIKVVDIEKVKPYTNNPRKNDGKAVDKVANSIKKYGFRNPIIVDKNMTVIAGHTRLKAAHKLKLQKIPVIIADDLSDDEIKAYRIADNRVAQESDWDIELLIFEIDSLEDKFTLDDLGFDNTSEIYPQEFERTDISEKIKEQFQIIIDCEDEQEMERIYNELKDGDYNCRISTL